MEEINLDSIFNGVVTAAQGASDTIDAFTGKPNRRELVHPNLQNQQNGMTNYYANQMMNQQPLMDYSNIGYENQGVPSYGSFPTYLQSYSSQYGMHTNNYPINYYQQQNAMLPGNYYNQGHYDEAYG